MRKLIYIVIFMALGACAPAAPAVVVGDLPEGNPANGETLFMNGIGSLAACEGCHSLDGSRKTGPTLQNYAATAATRPGNDPHAYTVNSIVSPGSYLVSGFSNIMPPNYGTLLSRQQLADLIAFLMTL